MVKGVELPEILQRRQEHVNNIIVKTNIYKINKVLRDINYCYFFPTAHLKFEKFSRYDNAPTLFPPIFLLLPLLQLQTAGLGQTYLPNTKP